MRSASLFCSPAARRWFLRFKNDATGIVSRPQAAEFSAAGLFVLGYPPLPYKLDPDGLFAHEVRSTRCFQGTRQVSICSGRRRWRAAKP